MRTIAHCLVFIALPPTLSTNILYAEEPLSRVEIAKIGKAATALVEIKARREYGSAFCVHSSGLFITNDHLAQDKDKVTLVLDPGLKTEKVYAAKVIRSDRDADLALLRIDGVKDLPTLAFGSDRDLAELMEVVAVGFPFGSALANGKTDNPAVSVNAGSITSLRLKDDQLHRIQMDVALNPGNSGGPVLDRSGRVVGVVVAGVRGSGVNFAIPVSAVARFVGKPDVEFEPPTLSPANAHKQTLFEARVIPVIPPKTPLTVDLTLEPAGGKKETHRMEAAGDKYRVTAIPLPPPPGPMKVRLSAQFADGMLNGTTTDRTIKVMDQEAKLSDLHGIRLGSNPRVTLADGKAMEGAVSGLGEVQVLLGGQTLSVNLDRAAAVKFSSAVESDRVDYSLIIRQGNTEVHRQNGRLIARGFLAASQNDRGAPGVTPPLLEGDKVVRKLSVPITDMVVGGGGRYLILHLASEQKLVVFDVSAADVIGHIPMPEVGARFAAGQEHVVVVLPQTGKIERWDLRTLERTASASVPVSGHIKAIAMGSASRGPLLVHWAKGTKPLDEALYTLVDLGTLKEFEANIKSPTFTGRGHYQDKVHLRASADGKLFGVWKVGSSGFGTIIVAEGGSESYYAHASVGYALPSPDGKFVFTGSGKQPPRVGRMDQLKAGDREVPACHGDYYLTLPPIRTSGAVSVGALGRARPVAILNDIELKVPDDQNNQNDFTADKRIHLIPDARLIILIPITNDRLILYRYGG